MNRGSKYIKDILTSDPFVMAPMAGVCDAVFRKIVREMGCTLVCSEMLSDNALIFRNPKTMDMLKIDVNDHPISVQIFGSEAEAMAKAAKIVEDAGADIIDINMGCPTPKITKNGEGSALMTEPLLARDIIRAVIDSVDVPVTVKMRKGWSPGKGDALEISKIAEDEGAAAVAVHGRYREQFYSGKADWDVIKKVKENLSIPVVGNGDIFDPEDALSMMRTTGCDGVMIARGALGNPWIFYRSKIYRERGILPEEPSAEDKIDMAIRHLRLMTCDKEELSAIRQMRKHIAWYIKGLRNAAKIRSVLNELDDVDSVVDLLHGYLRELQ